MIWTLSNPREGSRQRGSRQRGSLRWEDEGDDAIGGDDEAVRWVH
jgi:hypothetical protein